MTAALLHTLLDDRARRTPDGTAVRRGDRRWTYAELRARSVAAAGWLARHGVERGDRVLVLDHNDMETVALVYAASRVGASYVVVSARTRPYLLGHILSDCAPRLVLGGTEAAAQARELTAAPVFTLAELPDADEYGWSPDDSGLLASEPVSLIYTSGSTALPKAVVSTHQQVLFAVDAIAGRLGYRSDDVVLCCLPLAFDYGLYQAFLSCAAGATLVLGVDQDAAAGLLRRIVEDRVTVLPLVPSLAVMLCNLLRRAAEPPPLRMVTNTGANLSPALSATMRELVPGLAVVGMFGLTECKRVAIGEPDLDRTRPGAVGRALPGTEAFVVGPDGDRLPAGEVGELVVRGPHVMAGYWNAPELTAARFRRDYLGRTALHTGDRCRMDADGYLYFVGRGDEVYKQNGFRISTAEVEAAAADIPGVLLAIALPACDEHGARLAVTGEITRERLAKELRVRMEDAKVPPECLVLESLPLTTNGKIDRAGVLAGWADWTAAGAR
ncbi:class I adenylate-forming enzyme family protein [Actinokineospora sp.]|uniref:class I adenylate-forming enzyme family protein n=1 Tax=Actinokineospora sp. TaxID=1872133 RepID=UPI00403814F3